MLSDSKLAFMVVSFLKFWKILFMHALLLGAGFFCKSIGSAILVVVRWFNFLGECRVTHFIMCICIHNKVTGGLFFFFGWAAYHCPCGFVLSKMAMSDSPLLISSFLL